MRSKEIKEFIGKELYDNSFVFSVARKSYRREVLRFKLVKNTKKHLLINYLIVLRILMIM